jgi:hypothetical protein
MASDIAETELDLSAVERLQPPLVIEPCEFWMVWTKHGKRPPRYAHSTYQSAEAEVERLARKHPGRKFFILEAVSKRHFPALVSTPTEA